jgi:hypothetical protein
MARGQKTYSQIELKVLTDLDLLDETIIGTGAGSEMMGYCNEAIHQAESLILSLNEEYFLARPYSLALTSGTADYTLPSDIFADKIRRVVYANGSTIYPIKRARFSAKFEEYSEVQALGASDYYQYMILNDSTAGITLRLFPASRETSSSNVLVWYLREAKQVTATTDTVDIPEFHAFIEKYMKVECMRKEGHPMLAMAIQSLNEERQLMLNTLSNRVPDEDDRFEMDFSHYREHR